MGLNDAFDEYFPEGFDGDEEKLSILNQIKNFLRKLLNYFKRGD
jgi:hypothetical protein